MVFVIVLVLRREGVHLCIQRKNKKRKKAMTIGNLVLERAGDTCSADTLVLVSFFFVFLSSSFVPAAYVPVPPFDLYRVGCKS